MHIVGLDLGKRKSQACVGTLDGVIVAERRLATSREALGELIAKFSPTRLLVEASTSAEWVARFLESRGVEVVVADPRFGPMYARADRAIKTDRRDAQALFHALRLGAFRPAHRRSDAHRLLRQQLLVRASLVRTRARLVSQVRSLLEAHGHVARSCAVEHLTRHLEALELEPALGMTILPLIEEIDRLGTSIESLDAEVEAAAKRHDVARRFDEVVGIGPVTALAVVAALDDPARFSSARAVASYLGVVPRENSSGERKARGRTTKSGDALTRAYLVEAAWRILRSKRPDVAPLREWALAVAERRGERRAVVALTRRLARILYAMWRDGTSFNSARLSRGE